MGLLITLLFLLLSVIYILTIHKSDYTLSPYIAGIMIGIGILPIVLLLKVDFSASTNVFLNTSSYFVYYFLLPSVAGLLLYFLCNFKAFEIKTVSAALQGIWTIFLCFANYEMAKIPDNTIYFILSITYFCAILFFDFLLQVIKISHSLVLFVLTYLLTLGFCAILCFSFVLWLYKYSPFLYFGLPLLFDILLVGSILLLKWKASNRSEVHSLL